MGGNLQSVLFYVFQKIAGFIETFKILTKYYRFHNQYVFFLSSQRTVCIGQHFKPGYFHNLVKVRLLMAINSATMTSVRYTNNKYLQSVTF